MRFYYLLFNILLFTNVISQNSVDYPLDIPIILSGTFGELRPNHFHAGIDIKTQGIEGLNVYSIADGYISRIQITHGGNGKALYIKHDNGQSSVYAHLKKFSKKIEKIVKKVQYSKESYTVKIFPKKNEYRITAKEIIGLSGNTGRSTGPHLHYELRDNKDRPINPMKYKFYKVKDTIPPVISGLYFKNFTKNISGIKYNEASFSKLKIKKINNSLFRSDTLKISGLIGFGVNSYDRMNNTWNKMGLSEILTSENGIKKFDMNLNKFSYEEWRHINNFIDYSTYKKSKFRVQKLYIEENNPLSMYNRELGDGILNINDTNSYVLYSIKLYDYNNNFTEILIPIMWVENRKNHIKDQTLKYSYNIERDSIYNIDLKNSNLEISKNTFYHNTKLQIFHIDNVLHLDKDTIPLLKPITIKFNLNRYNDSIIDKLYVANGNTFVSNKLKEKKIIAKTSVLGDFHIKIDTKAPELNILNLKEDQWASKMKKIKIKVSDYDSGIKKYDAWINNRWILLEFNPSTGILSYDFNDNIINDSARNDLLVKIEDNCGNISELSRTFFRKPKR